MSKSPAFQFYPADWLSDENVELATLAEEGAYIRAVAYCWREGSIPADPEKLSRLLKNCGNQIATTVQRWFVVSSTNPDRLVHPRLESEREKQREWAEKSAKAGVESGKARRAKKLHTEPNMNGGSNLVEPKVNSSSSSSSSINTPPNARATHAHALHLQQELQIPVSMRETEVLLQVIDFEARNRGGPEKATDWLIEEGRLAKSRGETVNLWWLKDKRYEKGVVGGGNHKARTSGNYEALRNALEELPEEGADGASRGEAGSDNRGNVEVIRPPSDKVRA